MITAYAPLLIANFLTNPGGTTVICDGPDPTPSIYADRRGTVHMQGNVKSFRQLEDGVTWEFTGRFGRKTLVVLDSPDVRCEFNR